jgi:flagellar basal body-associated protein FliL
MIIVKPRRKRKSEVRKNPLMLLILIVALLGILSVVMAYFILNGDEEKQATPAETTTETQQDEEEPVMAVEPAYTGTWVSNYDGAILTLNRTSFTLEMPSVDKKTPVKGELTVAKDVLTFVYTSGSESCRGVAGQYRFKLEDSGDIFFKLINDSCQSRKSRMEVSWFRL